MNILLIQIARMGDWFQTLPTVHGLREKLPDSRITVVCDERIVEAVGDEVDEVIPLPLESWLRQLKTKSASLISMFAQARSTLLPLLQGTYDQAISFNGAPLAAEILQLVHAKRKSGWQNTALMKSTLHQVTRQRRRAAKNISISTGDQCFMSQSN